MKALRRQTFFVRQTGPVEIVGFPRLCQQVTRVTQESGERSQIEKFAGGGLRQSRVGDAEILRQPLRIDLLGVFLREPLKFLPGFSPAGHLRRILALKLQSQVEGLRRRHAGKGFFRMPGVESLLQLAQPPRKHAIGEDVHDLFPQAGLLPSARQQFFAELLVEGDGMKLLRSHLPPTRQDRAGHQGRNQILPDEGLDVFRHDELLFDFRQDVGEAGKSAGQTHAAAGGIPAADQSGAKTREVPIPAIESPEKSWRRMKSGLLWSI